MGGASQAQFPWLHRERACTLTRLPRGPAQQGMSPCAHRPGKLRVGRAGDTRPAMGHDPLTYQGPRPLQYPQGTTSGRTGAVASRSSCSPELPAGLPVCAPTWAACHHGPGRPGHRTIGRRSSGAAIAAPDGALSSPQPRGQQDPRGLRPWPPYSPRAAASFLQQGPRCCHSHSHRKALGQQPQGQEAAVCTRWGHAGCSGFAKMRRPWFNLPP